MAKNYIDKDGLHTQNINEIKEELISEYKKIYGQDININSDTPDGQRINIEAQDKADILDFATQVYNSFDVDSVRGVAQDRLYKLNNVYRKSSKYSFVQVNVTATKDVNLQGLNERLEGAYTVSDQNGHEFILVDSTVISAGTTLLEFRAKEVGGVETLPNTITNMVTILAGISSVSNPAKQFLKGTDQETDADFNIRRNKSTAISGKGFEENLYGDLLSIPLVTSVAVYENDGNVKEIPQESSTSAIWCIVEGGTNEDIGKVIYANKTLGCKQVGDTTVNINKPDGRIFVARFDRPQNENLHIKMTIKSKLLTPPDTDFIKSELVRLLNFGIYEDVDVSEVSAKVIEIDPNVYVKTIQLSKDGLDWQDIVTPTTKDKFFVLDVSRIAIEVAQ